MPVPDCTLAPGIEAIIETSIYADDLHSMEAFYSTVLGLSVIGTEPGRHIFFRVGVGNVLLVFKPGATLQGGVLPAHGANGSGHFALGVRTEALEKWRQHLIANKVAIEKEITWPNGGKSIYFRDPAGNSVELITPGVWGTPSGW